MMKNLGCSFFRLNQCKRKNDEKKQKKTSIEQKRKAKISDVSSHKGLLDMLSYEVGCLYVSDLHNEQLLPLIRHVLLKTDEKDYNIQEWYELIHYITGQRVSFLHQNEAKDYLVNYCENYKKKSYYQTKQRIQYEKKE